MPTRSNRARAFELFTDTELRLAALVLSPDYIIPAAEHHGGGDPVLGARAAYYEARGVVRSILYGAYTRHRHKFARDQKLKDEARRSARCTLEALGFRGYFQEVGAQIDTAWRRLAGTLWPTGQAIAGWVELGGLPGDSSRVQRAALRAVSQLLVEHPDLNRTVLDGRVWGRLTPEVMFHVECEPDEIRPLVLDPSRVDDRAVAAILRGEIRKLARLRKHRLAPVGDELLRAWCEAGFIASPAGAMVSSVGPAGVECGLPTLIPGNGVPIAVAVGHLDRGHVVLGISLDHRALDASHGGRIHTFLKERVQELCVR